MRIYWTLGSIPELAHLPPRQRRDLWRRRLGLALRHWQGWMSFLVAIVSMSVGVTLGLAVTESVLVSIVVAGTIGALGGLASSQLMISAVRPYLRTPAAPTTPSEQA